MGKLHDESNEINFPRLFSFTFDRKNVNGLRFENFPQPCSRHRLQSRWISRGSRIETRKIEIRAAPLAGYVKLEGSKAHRIEFLAGIPFYALPRARRFDSVRGDSFYLRPEQIIFHAHRKPIARSNTTYCL